LILPTEEHVDYVVRIAGDGGIQKPLVINAAFMLISPPPGNDNCGNATIVYDGTTPYSNTAATTDGPDEPIACYFNGYTHIESDIWYRYTASCKGTVHVDLCDSNFDTKLAVYEGWNCPPGAPPIACDDSGCANGPQSKVSFDATENAKCLIRIGGHHGAQGNGFMVIYCEPETAEFKLHFEAPHGQTLGGAPGASYLDTVHCRPGTMVNQTSEGAQGWSVGMIAEGVKIVDITTDGTAGADRTTDPLGYRDGGFELSEITTGPGNEGAVSTVVLSHHTPITLPPEGDVRIARIGVESTFPPPGEIQPVGLYYVHGLRGSRGPIDNTVTHQDSVVMPAMHNALYHLVGSPGNWVLYDYNGDGRLDISDAIGHLDSFSRGTSHLAAPRPWTSTVIRTKISRIPSPS
jgi:hypothetical protein